MGINTAQERPQSWVLVHYDRPPTTNDILRVHRMQRHELTKEWRHAFTILAREAKIPLLDAIRITAQSHLKGRRSRDWGADFLVIKAAVDGIADAVMGGNDDLTHMLGGTILAPILGAERDALVLVVEAA